MKNRGNRKDSWVHWYTNSSNHKKVKRYLGGLEYPVTESRGGRGSYDTRGTFAKSWGEIVKMHNKKRYNVLWLVETAISQFQTLNPFNIDNQKFVRRSSGLLRLSWCYTCTTKKGRRTTLISNYFPLSVSPPKTNIEVMRIKEMITTLRSSWLSNKFSLSVP